MSSRTLNLNDTVYQYLLSVSLREHPILKELRSETMRLPEAVMQISPEQGQFMALLTELTRAQKVIEVGVYTGYSSLSVALAMPPEGRLIACDVNEAWTNMAQKYWKKAGVENKIQLKLAPANDTLDALLAQGEHNTFDLAFIDADKSNYISYYEKLLTLLKPNGLILIDNVLWGGKVADDHIQDADTRAIRELNRKIHDDGRVSLSLLPIGDGLTLVRKK